MAPATLISYAQNGEDVVLDRAFRHIDRGVYIDVGACDPVQHSVTKVLYDRGWRGIDIDPVPEYVARFREQRPGNEVVHAAITDLGVAEVTLHQLVDTGLSTLIDDTANEHEDNGFERRDITVPASTLDAVCAASSLLNGPLHLLKVDVEGAETQVLRSIDLRRWRPWVIVVEATKPLSSEPSFDDWDPILTEAGYRFCLFDGLSRFYVSEEHQNLAARLSYPACVLDDYMTIGTFEHLNAIAELEEAKVEHTREFRRITDDMLIWRNRALEYWATSLAVSQTAEAQVGRASTENARLRTQLKKARAHLQQLREERKRLRVRVRRLRRRLDAQQAPPAPSRPHRLRSALRRIQGA